MTGTATVTGKIGPELTSTAVLFQNVQRIEYDLYESIVRIVHGTDNKIAEYQLSNIATITMTVSGVTVTTTLST